MPANGAAAALEALRATGGGNDTKRRDPRAAPTSTKKNITVDESCAFYGVTDSISKCRYPRTCQDCLAKPGCVLTWTGACATSHDAADGYLPLVDYHDHLVAGVTNYSQPHKPHNFFSANATYCANSDLMCASCRTEFQQLALSPSTPKTLGTQFCVGTDGCVCIAICEVPQYRETQVYDQECGQHKPVFKDPNGPTRPSFTPAINRRDPRVSLDSTRDKSKTPASETCALYGERDLQGCRKPRTCRDCLARTDCLIANHQCTTLGNYDPAEDYRNNRSDRNASSYVMFPASNTTYCAANDSVCTQCMDAPNVDEFGANNSFSSPFAASQFCIGTDGCVCIEFCESELWAASIQDTECRQATYSDSGWSFISIGVAMLVWFVVALLYDRRRIMSRRQTRQTVQQATGQVMRHMLDQAPAVMRLDLFGWRVFHQRLLDKEQELLDGNGDVSPVAPPVDFSFEFANAPDFDDEEDATAPTVSDPHAMASAPSMYHRQRQLSATHQRPQDMAHLSTMPSAPDFGD